MDHIQAPEGPRYTRTHEWLKFLDNALVEIGLTDFAQRELGDIVFVNLPEVGAALVAGTAFADVESVKAVSDIYSPMNGTVEAVNPDLAAAPEAINQTPYEAWLVRARGEVPAGADLLDAAGYAAFVRGGA